MPCTCCLTICYSRNSLEDKTWEEFVSPSRSSERAQEIKTFQHNGEKVFILLLSLSLGGKASGIFLGMSSKKWSFCAHRVPSTPGLGAGSGCWNLFPEFHHGNFPNLSPGKTQGTKIPPTAPSHGGDPNIQEQQSRFPYGNSCERDLYTHKHLEPHSHTDAFRAAASEAQSTSLVPQFQQGTSNGI